MPRSNPREKTGWLDVLSLLPWWACLVLAVLSDLFLEHLAGKPLHANATVPPNAARA